METDLTGEQQRAARTEREDVLAGVRDILPATFGVIPYALILGFAAASTGLTVAQTVSMSSFVYAGLAQLAMIDLFSQQASIVVVVATALIINLRFMVYSASMAPHFERLNTEWRWLCSFLLVAPVYAIALNAFEQDRPTHYGWYFLGVAVPMWAIWVGGTLAGMVVGAHIPTEWQLGFTVQLIFIAILMQFVEDRSTVMAALVGGGVSVAVAGLPLNLGLLIATVVGIGVGLETDRRNT